MSYAATKDVKAKVNGAANTKIGTLTANVSVDGGSGKNVAEFKYVNVNNLNKLDDCYEMRWFQFITSDDWPAKYGGVNQTHIVDPPKGGWDYQAADGGADNEPFYENSGNGNYAYPNFKDRRVKYDKSWTDDYPYIGDANAGNKGKKTVWQTWLVAREIGKNAFCLLLGYEWEVGVNNTPDKYAKFNNWIEPGDANIGTMTTALTNGGFTAADWPISKDCALTCAAVPEPSSMAALALGGLAMLRRRRQKSA